MHWQSQPPAPNQKADRQIAGQCGVKAEDTPCNGRSNWRAEGRSPEPPAPASNNAVANRLRASRAGLGPAAGPAPAWSKARATAEGQRRSYARRHEAGDAEHRGSEPMQDERRTSRFNPTLRTTRWRSRQNSATDEGCLLSQSCSDQIKSFDGQFGLRPPAFRCRGFRFTELSAMKRPHKGS